MQERRIKPSISSVKSVIEDTFPGSMKPRDPGTHERVMEASRTIKVEPPQEDFSDGLYTFPDNQRDRKPKLRRI